MTEYKPWAGKAAGGFFWHKQVHFSDRKRTSDELPTEVFQRLRNLSSNAGSFQSRQYTTEAEAMADLQQAQQAKYWPVFCPHDKVWRFYDESDHLSRDLEDLPSELFTRLKHGVLDQSGGRKSRDYRSEAEALADLACASIIRDATETPGLTFYDPLTGACHELSDSAVKYLKALWS